MIEERAISGRGVAQVALTTSQFTGESIEFDGDYMMLRFTRDRTATPALPSNTSIWSCMSMRVDLFDLARHGPNYASTFINIGTLNIKICLTLFVCPKLEFTSEINFLRAAVNSSAKA